MQRLAALPQLGHGQSLNRPSWGCKPEPPKIPTENVAHDVSGLFGYPTRFPVHVLEVKADRFWSGHVSAGKQLFSGQSGGFNLVEQVGVAV